MLKKGKREVGKEKESGREGKKSRKKRKGKGEEGKRLKEKLGGAARSLSGERSLLLSPRT